MGKLSFIQMEEMPVINADQREELLIQFSKTEKIATEVEFILPQRTSEIGERCSHYVAEGQTRRPRIRPVYDNPEPDIDDEDEDEEDEDGVEDEEWYEEIPQPTTGEPVTNGPLCSKSGGTPQCLERGSCPWSDRNHFSNLLNSVFEPSRSDTKWGKRGFSGVKAEGSLPNGLEITTVGRRIVYQNLFQQNEFLIQTLRKLECSVNYRCGLHFHYLIGYFPTGGSEPFKEIQCEIPSIVLANLYQLHLLNMDALLWISSAGTSTEFPTRYLKFRSVPFDLTKGTLPARFNIKNTNIKRIIDNWSKNSYQPKYAFLNMCPTRFNKGAVDIFHFEERYPDAVLSAHFLTMFQILTAALVKKAISLSEFGIIIPDNNETYNEIASNIIYFCGETTHNGDDIDGNDFDGLKRRGRSNITPAVEANMVSKAKALIRFLKPEICSYAPTVYTQLLMLVDNPIFKLRNDGATWEEIDALFTIAEEDKELAELIDGLYALTALQIVEPQPNIRVWVKEISALLDLDENKILDAVSRANLQWDPELGCCVRQY